MAGDVSRLRRITRKKMFRDDALVDGIDRPATPVFADAIERLVAAPAPPPEGAPWWGYGVRLIVLTGAAVGVVGAWLHGPDPLRRARRVVHHTHKVIDRARARTSSRMRRRAKRAGKQWQKSVVKPLKARWS